MRHRKAGMIWISVAVIVATLSCFLVGKSNAQPISRGPFGTTWLRPTVVNPQDVSIGSEIPLATDDTYQSFLRFSSPVDINIKIEGNARWYPDPEAALFEMRNGRPVFIKQDDDSGPGRDFLIEHLIKANTPYLLQLGTRTSAFTLVRISTTQIAVHSQLGSHALQTITNFDNLLIGGAGDQLALPPVTSGRRRAPQWGLGTDFGTAVQYFGSTEREFQLEDFASPSSTFSIDRIFIAETTNPFVLRSNPVPMSHQNSFEASLLSGNRIKVEFNPLAQGLIQSTLVIEYTSNGATRKAQLPLSGRGSSSFSLNRRLSISGAGQMFGVLNYRLSSNFESLVDADRNRSVWLNLDFERPVRNVHVYLIPKNGSSHVNASFYESKYEYSKGKQLQSNPLTGFTYRSIPVNRQSSVNMKIALPTDSEIVTSDFVLYVIGKE